MANAQAAPLVSRKSRAGPTVAGSRSLGSALRVPLAMWRNRSRARVALCAVVPSGLKPSRAFSNPSLTPRAVSRRPSLLLLARAEVERLPVVHARYLDAMHQPAGFRRLQHHRRRPGNRGIEIDVRPCWIRGGAHPGARLDR